MKKYIIYATFLLMGNVAISQNIDTLEKRLYHKQIEIQYVEKLAYGYLFHKGKDSTYKELLKAELGTLEDAAKLTNPLRVYYKKLNKEEDYKRIVLIQLEIIKLRGQINRNLYADKFEGENN